MRYYDAECNAMVTLTCGGKPLEGPYLPPPSALAELGRYLARKYGAKDAQLGDIPKAGKGADVPWDI